MTRTIKFLLLPIAAIAGIALLWGRDAQPAAAPVTVVAPPQPIVRWQVLLADGTDVKDAEHATPRVDTAFIGMRIDSIHNGGGGGLYLLAIDANAANNTPLLLEIPAKGLVFQGAPERRAGEGPMSYKKRMDEYRKAEASATSATLQAERQWRSARAAFLKSCQLLLADTYRQDNPEHKKSDVIGAFNKAFNILREVTAAGAAIEKAIVGFTDAVHNVKGRTLHPIPTDVAIIIVNPAAESTAMCLPDSAITLVAHPARVSDALAHGEASTTVHH